MKNAVTRITLSVAIVLLAFGSESRAQEGRNRIVFTNVNRWGGTLCNPR